MEEQIFERGNVSVIMSGKGCWLTVEDDSGVQQKLAVEPSELLLFYIALGDALKDKV